MITVLADPNLPDLRAFLHPSVRLVNYDLKQGWTPEELAASDALLVRTTHKVNRNTLPAGSKVRFVGTASAGRDHIDEAWLAELGVRVSDAAGSNAQSVAEYVAAAMVWWSEKRGERLPGLRTGIVGCGHTGTAVAQMLRRLGCACVLYDPPREERERGDDAPFQSATLEQVLACDVLTLHVPLEYDGPWATWHWLNAEKLGLVQAGAGKAVADRVDVARAGAGKAVADRVDAARAGAGKAVADRVASTVPHAEKWQNEAKKLVINASRGGVVDEQALRQAAQTGRVTDYVCDVWEGEPIFDDRTLARALIATPHIAGYSLEAKRIATVMLVQALHNWMGLPAPRVPVPQPAEARIEGGESTAGQVLEQLHPGLQTDRELRALAGLNAQAKAEGFHTLRHRTGLRREFDRLHLADSLCNRIPELRALGFACGQSAVEHTREQGRAAADHNIEFGTATENHVCEQGQASEPIHPKPVCTKPIHPKP